VSPTEMAQSTVDWTARSFVSRLVEVLDQSPTDAQKDAGNYRKGHVRRHGLEITIETQKGQMRSGTGKGGKEWSTIMKADYGYILDSKGRDKEHVDCFLGPDEDAERVFVVNQTDKSGKFDEHKVVFGVGSESEARELYLSNYEKGWKCGPIKAMTVDEFKDWIADEGATKRVAEKFVDEAVSRDDHRGFARLSEIVEPRTSKVRPVLSAVNQFLRVGVNVKTMQLLGKGTKGYTFDVGAERVAKFTTDPKEAAVSNYAKGLTWRYVWRVYGVYLLKPAQVLEACRYHPEMVFKPKFDVWLIVGEKLFPVSNRKAWLRAFRWIKVNHGIRGTRNLNQSIFDGMMLRIERMRQSPDNLPPVQPWLDYAAFILRALMEMKSQGIEFHDTHVGNIGMSPVGPKFFDLGYSTAPSGSRIPVLERLELACGC
jgi:hypothetical protein